jgi:hypothetical protein
MTAQAPNAMTEPHAADSPIELRTGHQGGRRFIYEQN